MVKRCDRFAERAPRGMQQNARCPHGRERTDTALCRDRVGQLTEPPSRRGREHRRDDGGGQRLRRSRPWIRMNDWDGSEATGRVPENTTAAAERARRRPLSTQVYEAPERAAGA